MQVKTANVWADVRHHGGVPVQELLVPVGVLDVLEDDALWVDSRYGRWPARRGGSGDGPLTAQLPVVRRHGARIDWSGDRGGSSPDEIVASYRGALSFRSWDEDSSLRRPQWGALHAVLGHWASGTDHPGVVVMPTGTGKTETMLALLVAGQMRRVLVIVPTDALRAQVAAKYERLGVLQEEAIVAPTARRPRVARLDRRVDDVGEAQALVRDANVVVATPTALGACQGEVRSAMLAAFSHLIVDEAHHAPARSWAEIIEAFADRPVLLFTATPYREDGRAIPGRTIFRFPLREAQRDGYFCPIDHRAVLDVADTDRAIAESALARLDADLAAGHDHLLMARARSIQRAEEIGELYRRLGARHRPEVMHHRASATRRRTVREALESRATRVIVCVDMLGEGFDLPALKVAAFHDPHRSLSPAVQLIGRFARGSSGSTARAAVFIPRDPALANSPLRALLREDADWNLLLRDLTERATAVVEKNQQFDASFTGVPDDVPLQLLEPKMSATAHRAPSSEWEPDRALAYFGVDNVVGGTVALGSHGLVAWVVVERNRDVRWGDVPELRETTYELIAMSFDPERRVLCIHGSNTSGSYSDLAVAVLGGEASVVDGAQTYRVFAGLDRITPTNVGLVDVRDHFARFSMFVGSDVGEAVAAPERAGRSQTHIATSAFDHGEKVTINAALSGRFWSTRTASSIREWDHWCRTQVPKLLDARIDLETVAAGFIIPVDVDERPPYVLLGLEWPWELYGGESAGPTVRIGDSTSPALDLGFEVDDLGREGPFLFSVVAEDRRIRYSADFVAKRGLVYRALDADAWVDGRAPGSLASWINEHKPTLFLEGDRLLTGDDRLHSAQQVLEPFDRTRLVPLDWAGVDIRVESQGVDRRSDSIQAFVSSYVRAGHRFDVLVDDDRAGEAADLVGLTVEESWLVVTLVHCKYSSSDRPGARLVDLYELCGQAVRGARWRRGAAAPLLRHLHRRVVARARRGYDAFDVGDLAELLRVLELAPQLRIRFRTVLAQPGLSAAGATGEHLQLLAGAESYVRAVTKGAFEVLCSA